MLCSLAVIGILVPIQTTILVKDKLDQTYLGIKIFVCVKKDKDAHCNGECPLFFIHA